MMRVLAVLVLLAVVATIAPAGAAMPAGVGVAERPLAPAEAGEMDDACVGADPHPTAARLSEQYGVPYDQIMGWFCDGRYGLGEIKLALRTGEQTGTPAEELLAMKTELGGWGLVWQELGIVGKKDKEAVAAGGQPAEGKRGGPWQEPPGLAKKDKTRPAKGKP